MSKLKTKFALFLTLSILIISVIGVSANPWDSEYSPLYTLDNGNITDHIWSDDGSKIAYVTCPTGQTWDCELWTANWNLKNNKLIFTGIQAGRLWDWEDEWILMGIQYVNPPQLTEDGKAITSELWKIKDDGSELIRITSTYTNGIRVIFGNYWLNIGTAGWARFIPETDLIYFSAHRGNGWWAPYTTTDDGNDQWKRLHHRYAFTIGMSPSGNKLLWGSSWYWNQPTTLYTGDYDGSNIHLVSSFPVKTSPLELLDEYTIILSWPGGDIHAINMDGTNHRIVIDDEYNNHWADYHPHDENAFIMTSNRADDMNNHVFKINPDGTGIVQLTDGAYNDIAPKYAPNGKFIAYRRLPDDFDTSTSTPYPYQLVVKDLTVIEIKSLISDVMKLYDMGVLNKGQTKSLIVKLDHAIEKYTNYQTWTAKNIMYAFIHQVEDFIEEGILTPIEGQHLIDQAMDIIYLIGTYEKPFLFRIMQRICKVLKPSKKR